MDRIRITGGQKLSGIIPISGAKNAALPLMIASLLTPETLTLENMPRLADVRQLNRILSNHGVDHAVDGKRPGDAPHTGETVHFSARNIVDTTAPYELVSKMRASFWVLAPLLARMGEARVSLPGGCAIGTRPVDFLLMALERLGAQIKIENGYVIASAARGLVGAVIDFPKAASEPEVVDLANCLIAMGARIRGAGTPVIEVEGVTSLHGARHAVLPDRIETGTYAMAVAMAGGDVLLEGARADLLEAALDVIAESGSEISVEDKGVRIRSHGGDIEPVDVTTDPFPGFPTDLQAQFMALMTRANGVSHITETIFENRFMHVQELARLGARIRLDGDTAIIEGQPHLTGAPVMATDLRASVSLVIAGLAAKGDTTVHRVYHLDRGFERLEEKLGGCGAQIERLSDQG